MKNQYFADVNDYRKYGLLRQLAHAGISVGVCWMLTPSDGRRYGRLRQYCCEPEKWRAFDPVLYDTLRPCAADPNRRNVVTARKSQLIPNAAYYEALLRDGGHARSEYFVSALQALAACDLIFFDPDNGLEVVSVPAGRQHSNKYLYWLEVKRAFAAGRSVLIYQHFPRVKRDSYIERRTRDLATHTGSPAVFALATSFVLFLLAAQVKHLGAIQSALGTVVERWPNQIREVTRLLPNNTLHPTAA